MTEEVLPSGDAGVPDAPLPPTEIESAAKKDTITYQIRGLFVGYAGLEYLNRVVQQQFLYDRSKIEELNRQAEILHSNLGRYNEVIELVNKKNVERLDKVTHNRGFESLEDRTLDVYASMINDEKTESVLTAGEAAKIYLRGNMYEQDEKLARRVAANFYIDHMRMFARTFRLEPDPIMVAAWFGFNLSYSRAYKAAYEAIRTMMQDVCALYGWDFFQISRSDYARHLEDLKYENIRGDQTTSIDSKAMLQLIVYGAWNNIGLNDTLPILIPRDAKTSEIQKITLADIFDLAGEVECLGWLKESHKVAFQRHWERAHRVFKALRTEIEGPLMRKFQAEINNANVESDDRFRPVLQNLAPKPDRKTGLPPEHSFSTVFQVNTDYSWMSGALPLNMEFTPCESFELQPSLNFSNVSLYNGAPGSGKTTLLSSKACAAIQKERQVVFMFLSDNMNWPTYAFMPVMEIEGLKNKIPAYKFVTNIGVKPEGVPTIILDIVKSVDELMYIPLTKYDRIIKVDAYSSFNLDFDRVLADLKEVASEFGYKESTGIVACRYLHRAGKLANDQPYNNELVVASTMLNNFLKWRETHASQAICLQMDEAAEGAAVQTPSKSHYELRDKVESAIRTVRRANMTMDVATQLTTEISPTVRHETANNFFKNLKETNDRRKSPMDVMLEQLGLDDETKRVVKEIHRDKNFVNSHAVFWHSTRLQKLNMIFPIPASFMPQVPSANALDIYRFYMRKYGILEENFLMKEPEIWLDLSEKRKGDDDKRSGGTPAGVA